MSPSASAPDVLDRLVEQYQAVPAPAPSADLLARMDAGRVGSIAAVRALDDDRDADRAAVVAFEPRPRVKWRYLVAATVAVFVAMSGLAVAGVLPDGLQRRVASVASEFGIDLPSPDSGSTPAGPAGTNGVPGGNGNTSGSKSDPRTGAGGAPTSSTPGSSVPSGVAGVLPLPLPVPSTAVPPTVEVPDLPPFSAPPLTVPPAVTSPGLGIPPVRPPSATLGPVTLPSLTDPPVSLPPISLPPLGLPGF